MYIYNVTIKISNEIKEDWLHWMRTEHMDEVLATGCFSKYLFKELLEPAPEPDENASTYIAQYYTDDIAKYEQYINQHAPILREKGFAKFGNQFIAFRTLMKMI